MKLAIASDHAGLSLKRELLEAARARKLEIEDLGPSGPESVDFEAFVDTPFEGGRHEKRVRLIQESER